MKKITISSLETACEIKANNTLLGKILEDDFTYHYIPNAIISDCECEIRVIENNSIETPVIIDYPTGYFNSNLSSRDVVTLAEYLLERRRQEKKGYYVLNSSTASFDNEAVTFWGGATNMGKTSSMLELVNNHDYDFISDERSVIDLQKLLIAGGSKSVPVRKEVIKQTTGCESEEFFKLIEERETKKARLFIYPHTDQGLKEPIYYKFEPLSFFWLLTRELSSVIRGSVRLVDNFDYQVPSIDTEHLSNLRIKRTKEFTQKVPCYYFQGTTKQIAEFVNKTISKQ
jgi:hypothetical protein